MRTAPPSPRRTHCHLGSKVASRCKLDEFIADAAAWRVRISANVRQRQLFDEVIGSDAAQPSRVARAGRDAPPKVKQRGKDEIDELFEAAGTESRPAPGESSKRASRSEGSQPISIPSNCDPSVAAVLSALGGSKKRKHK